MRIVDDQLRKADSPLSHERYGELPSAYRLPEGYQRGAVAGDLPRCLFIEVTNRCNLSCNTCPRTFTAFEELKTLTWKRFIHVVEQFPRLERAVLHGIGEPLLNKELVRFIDYLKARQVIVLFNTNGVLLDDEWSRSLISSGLDELRVSLDAASSQTYALVRGRPHLDKVMRNLARFVRLRRDANSEKPRVSIWMTGIRENIAELPQLVRLAARIGVPEVYVQRMVYYLDSYDLTGVPGTPGAPSKPGLRERAHGLFDHFDGEIEGIIAEAESVARELGITLRASGAADPRRSLAASRETAQHPWTACVRPWTTAYVTANGNCLPCCISPFATVDYDSLILGNLFDRDFAEIWNGDSYRAWRMALLGERPPTSCLGCGTRWSL